MDYYGNTNSIINIFFASFFQKKRLSNEYPRYAKQHQKALRGQG
jgi:hypothetical protein